jgi:MscS family membrane protein
MRAPLGILLVWLTLLLCPSALAASAAPPAQPAAPDAAAEDPLGRTTPRGAVLGFIKAAQAEDYGRAAMYLDVRPGTGQAQDLAQQLKLILDRGLRVNLDFLSTRPEGALEDSTNPNRDLVGVVTGGGKSFDIHLDRVQRGKSPPLWLFASDTLRKVPEIYDEIGPPWIEAFLPRPLLDTRFLTFSLWQWIGTLLVIPIALLAARVFNSLLLIPALRPAVRYVTREQDDRQLSRIEWPVRLLTLVVASHVSMSLLALPFLARQLWGRIAMTLAIVGTTWLIIRLNHIVAELTGRHLAHTAGTASVSIVRLVQRLVTAVAILTGGLVFLYMLGFNLTAALAGLGVGGIAIALAAQKTLENLFGGIMLTSDQPVRVGDFCRFGDQVGTVEDIGLRSTRIRTPDRTLVSVPNGHFSSISLENFGLRDKIWFHPTIPLRYETTADQLRYVLAEIRRLLYAHPKVESQSARVRFVGLGSSSLNLEIFAYIRATDYAVFLEIQEDLLLRLMDIIERSGTSFAFPSHTVYLTKGPRLDAEKTQMAMEQVRQWRAQKDLPFPNFPPERIAQMTDTLDYPPSESALRRS